MAAYAEWDPALATGDTDVDTQHIALFSLCNELHDAIEAGHGREAVESCIDALVAYVHSHFLFEETLMERVAYPGLPLQIHQHREFIAGIEELCDDLYSGNNVSPSGLLEFIHSWLVEHIGREDRKIGAHIRALSE